jgi:hypothetical protein
MEAKIKGDFHIEKMWEESCLYVKEGNIKEYGKEEKESRAQSLIPPYLHVSGPVNRKYVAHYKGAKP